MRIQCMSHGAMYKTIATIKKVVFVSLCDKTFYTLIHLKLLHSCLKATGSDRTPLGRVMATYLEESEVVETLSRRRVNLCGMQEHKLAWTMV